MKNILVRIKKDKLPPLPPKIAAGRYTWKDVDQWMSRLGARPIPDPCYVASGIWYFRKMERAFADVI